jgi:geranylgeranyl pyrophosphate synthase
VLAYAEVGRALGTSRQLQSDCYDLLAKRDSKDLASGTRTLPIAWYLHGMSELLDRARTEPAAREEVRSHLIAAGAFRASGIVIELYCERARQALAKADPVEPAAGALRRRIDGASLFGIGS